MPFKSQAQRKYMNAHAGKDIPQSVVDEWNMASVGKTANLPEHVRDKVNYTRNAHYSAKDIHHDEMAEPPEPTFVKATKRKHPGKVQSRPRSYKKGKVGWSTGAKGDDGYMRPGGGKRDTKNLSTKKSAGTKPHNVGHTMTITVSHGVGGGLPTLGKRSEGAPSSPRHR